MQRRFKAPAEHRVYSTKPKIFLGSIGAAFKSDFPVVTWPEPDIIDTG
jgi:hypothetical protein